MYTLIYKISTGKILHTRQDTSSVITPKEEVLTTFLTDHDREGSTEYAIAEVTKQQFHSIDNTSIQIYDANTNSIIVDPSYSPPPTLATRTIPFSDPANFR